MVLGSHDVSLDLPRHLTSGYTVAVDTVIKIILNFKLKVSLNGTGCIAMKIATIEKSFIKKFFLPTYPIFLGVCYPKPN